MVKKEELLSWKAASLGVYFFLIGITLMLAKLIGQILADLYYKYLVPEWLNQILDISMGIGFILSIGSVVLFILAIALKQRER